jgi:flagellar secretion chaperone FliS
MYSTAPAYATFRPQMMAAAYRNVGVETGLAGASAHRLVEMLYEGFMESIAVARGALREGRIEAKGRAIGRAARIVEEGLRAGLNVQQGGQLAADLEALYRYVCIRLTHANLKNDEAALDECVRLMQPLAEAWKEIRTRVPS